MTHKSSSSPPQPFERNYFFLIINITRYTIYILCLPNFFPDRLPGSPPAPTGRKWAENSHPGQNVTFIKWIFYNCCGERNFGGRHQNTVLETNTVIIRANDKRTVFFGVFKKCAFNSVFFLTFDFIPEFKEILWCSNELKLDLLENQTRVQLFLLLFHTRFQGGHTTVLSKLLILWSLCPDSIFNIFTILAWFVFLEQGEFYVIKISDNQGLL